MLFEFKKNADFKVNPPSSEKILGYLNFSDGRCDPKWQALVNESFAALDPDSRPWATLLDRWSSDLRNLSESGSPGFRDIRQAVGAIGLARESLAAYRAYHSDLLGHCHDSELFGPLFLVRVLESVLRVIHDAEMPGESGFSEASSLAGRVVRDLNDFVGYRPVALLETRNTGEPYEHERHRPVPVFIRGCGFAVGSKEKVVERAFAFLRETSPQLLRDAGIDLEQIEELSVDMRSYDHGHPANLRPNQVFGEWDPARIDIKGRFSRLVVRKLIFDAIGDWGRIRSSLADPDESVSESAAVLCGTMLMSSGVTGGQPGAHDSTKRLGDLLPGIARYRDQFYRELQERMPPNHLERLRAEEKQVRQPFGKVRQFLNAWMARQRALQVQQQAMATLFARLGLPGSSAREARKITVLAPRFMCELIAGMKLMKFEGEQGRLDSAVGRLPAVVQKLRLGISCGALTDPWNVLGFQGMFPLSPAREDATRDTRLDDLLSIVERLFESMTLLWAESAARGDDERAGFVSGRMRELADWWDKFATYRVSDVRFVRGLRHLKAGRGVAEALSRWRQRGSAPADMVFWQKQVRSLRTAQTHALAVEALLRQGDLAASQGLLVHWISLADKIGLEDGQHNFYRLAFQWLGKAAAIGEPPQARVRRVGLFLGQLVVNAGEMLEVPRAGEFLTAVREDDFDPDHREDDPPPFDAKPEAGGLAEVGLPGDNPFDMEEQAERLERRLRFQAAQGRLMQEGARWLEGQELPVPSVDQLCSWREEACHRSTRALELARELLGIEVPPPSTPDVDSFLQYERRRSLRETLTNEALSASLEQRMAGLVFAVASASHKREVAKLEGDPSYLEPFIELGGALFRRDGVKVRRALPGFREFFREEPLLHTHLFQGGRPANLMRTRLAMQVLRSLLANLPRLGLFADTLELLRLARRMEDKPGPDGPGVTEFVQYYTAGLQAIVEAVVHSATGWEDSSGLVGILDDLVKPFEALWIEHSRSGQLSALEGIGGEKEYRALQKFIKDHGRELFHARFMTLANLRGILHRGPKAYLETMVRESDPLKPSRLADTLEAPQELKAASRRLEVIIKTVVENYEEFKDYNTTTTLSDYGENLNVLVDFLVLKSGYDRRAWELRPRLLVHEVLARQERHEEARAWQSALEERTKAIAEDQIDRLGQLERLHGVRLSTIRDRIEERFVRNLGLDRLCALIRPVLEQSRALAASGQQGTGISSGAEEHACPALASLREGLEPFMEKPAGVGRDVPEWIRKLELELQRASVTTLVEASAPERFFLIPEPKLARIDVLGEIKAMTPPDDSKPDSALAT